MADLFTSLVSIVPKPATTSSGGVKQGSNGTFTGPGLQAPQVQTPGK